MTVLVGIALKSLLIGGLTLSFLHLLRSRSAAERSWVAHTGLLALVIIAFAPLVLPKWTVETPALFSPAAPAAERFEAPLATGAVAPLKTPHVENDAARAVKSRVPTFDRQAVATAAYAIPAATLLIITFLALVRLFALQARADVLVDAHWLSALARAQRRMGFKHGTALLTSNELASPVSWGLMRPVILLNDRAIEASDEAEAIIAHELAHVARMDWIKLLLARLATALFWFNPLVWLLAREAHQLREEAADDSVLSADITDTDYAQLLVGVARHECPGLLLGAHGVAPSKSSLARRVARVLDGKSVRGPVARSFAFGVFSAAVAIAAPLAALTITPAGPRVPNSLSAGTSGAATSYPAQAFELPSDLPQLIANGVSTSVSTASAAIAPELRSEAPIRVSALNNARAGRRSGLTIARTPDGAEASVYPPKGRGRPGLVAIAPSGATAIQFAEAGNDPGAYADEGKRNSGDSAVKTAIEMKAAGITPDYAAAIRAASPALRIATLNEIMELKWLGVTPDYVRELSEAGFSDLRPAEIGQARAIGLTGGYLRAIRATGVPVTFGDLIELRAMGIRPEDLAGMRASGTFKPEHIRDHHRGPPQPPPLPGHDSGG